MIFRIIFFALPAAIYVSRCHPGLLTHAEPIVNLLPSYGAQKLKPMRTSRDGSSVPAPSAFSPAFLATCAGEETTTASEPEVDREAVGRGDVPGVGSVGAWRRSCRDLLA